MSIDKVTHDCMGAVSSESNDEYGVVKDRYLGVQSKHTQHVQFESGQCAQVEWYVPLISTVSLGEYVEVSEEDSFIRVKLVEIATRCREQAVELIKHAERLEEVASSEEVISSRVVEVDRPSRSRGVVKEAKRVKAVDAGRYKVDAASLNEL